MVILSGNVVLGYGKYCLGLLQNAPPFSLFLVWVCASFFISLTQFSIAIHV